MPEFSLAAEPFLGGYREQFPGAVLAELTDLSIVSVACPLGGKDRLAAAVRSAWSAELPAAGRSVKSADGLVKILNMSPDQFLVLSGAGPQPAVDRVARELGAAAYHTDQSDNWAALHIAGAGAMAALERICPIDLDPAAFPDGAVARTVMEHLGVIICRTGADEFTLLSASSSARSFLHAVETSLGNTS